MADQVYECNGVRVLEWDAAGAPPKRDRDVIDLIGAAGQQGASVVVLPAARLGAEFFDLKTRIAGEVLQKFLTYRLRVAIMGDIAEYVDRSSALRDFVYECNCGPHICFVADREDLGRRVIR